MKIKIDKLFAVLCLIAVVILFVSTGNIRDLASKSDPGARLIPYIGESLLALCSVLVLIESSDCKQSMDKNGWLKLLIILGCMVAYQFGLKYLGFLISTPIAAGVFIYLLGKDEHISIPVAITIVAVMTLSLYFLFTKGFSILLPRGILF